MAKGEVIDAAAIALEEYHVIDPCRFNNKSHKVGEIVKLTTAEGAPLVALKLIKATAPEVPTGASPDVKTKKETGSENGTDSSNSIN